jgi:hypothetical protein
MRPAVEINTVTTSSRNRRSRRWIFPILFLAWQAAAVPLYRAEWVGARTAARLWAGTADQQRIYADGPIYIAASAAERLTSPTSSVVFLNPASGAQGEFYDGKIKYYLWPRRITSVAVGQTQNLLALSTADAVVVFEPGSIPTARIEQLDRLGFFTKRFESAANRSYQAVYVRVK